MASVEVLRVQDACSSRPAASAFSYSLMLNFRRPTREKSYLLRIEEHASRREPSQCRGLAGHPDAACGRSRSEPLRACGSESRRSVLVMIGADIVALGEEELRSWSHPTAESCAAMSRGQLLIGLVEQLAGGQIDHVGSGHRAVELCGFNLDLFDLRCTQRLQGVHAEILRVAGATSSPLIVIAEAGRVPCRLVGVPSERPSSSACRPSR